MFSLSRALRLLSIVFLLQPVASRGETSSTAPDDQGWPRPLSSRAGIFSIYQPQLDSWDGFRYKAHAAVDVKVPGDSRDVYGVIWIEARTQVDKTNRLVNLTDVKIPKVQFPSVPDQGQAFQAALRESLGTQTPAALSPISLDRLEASLAITEAGKKSEQHPLKNDPPRFLFSSVPAILVTLVTAMASMQTAFNIVQEKESGTIEQINVTPIKKYIFITGKMIPFLVLGIINLLQRWSKAYGN